LIRIFLNSNGRNSGSPNIRDPPDFSNESRAGDLGGRNLLFRSRSLRFIRQIKRISEQIDIRSLKRFECLDTQLASHRTCLESWMSSYRLQVSISNTHHGTRFRIAGDFGCHIDDDDQFDSRIGQPAIHGETLVDGLKQAEILVHGSVRSSGLENVET
jgi:hypothetical protein